MGKGRDESMRCGVCQTVLASVETRDGRVALQSCSKGNPACVGQVVVRQHQVLEGRFLSRPALCLAHRLCKLHQPFICHSCLLHHHRPQVGVLPFLYGSTHCSKAGVCKGVLRQTDILQQHIRAQAAVQHICTVQTNLVQFEPVQTRVAEVLVLRLVNRPCGVQHRQQPLHTRVADLLVLAQAQELQMAVPRQCVHQVLHA
mmetsp:Transcript_40053/g.78742  ORF Transcript_40053/g.78742 Transcript_40053/m.78742 type:complete len:201 (-) Transcript_40053:1413-2015(-)